MTTDVLLSPPTDTWVAAVHASSRDFAPLGSAVVVDTDRVLTCAHVIASDGGIRNDLWVAFPKVGNCPRRRVARVITRHSPPVKDLAVLVLDEPVPAEVEAARLRFPRPADLVGGTWWAFGFPARDPVGNSADGRIGESLAYGWVRLDTSSRYLVEPGFSGGALWSNDYEAVVAVVGQAHGNGDGRAITLHQVDLDFPDLNLTALASWSVEAAGEIAQAQWGWILAHDPEGVRHWRPRARGVNIESERGWRFRGRTAALAEIVAWLDRPILDRRVLVVTGSPGVGKSAVLGRIVTTADAAIRASLPPNDTALRASTGSVGCAVHAKGKTALEVAEEVARAASATLPSEPSDLAPALRGALCQRSGSRFNVIIDALDEAASPSHARRIIHQIVLPLVETCSDVGTQVVVATRRRDDGGDLLGPFGAALAVLDLDDPDYFAEEDLAAYALACLQLAGDDRPNNPYADEMLAASLAARIAAMADQNFLVAGLVARAHGLHDREPLNPDQLRFAGTVDAALAVYLERLSPVAGLAAEHALTALAFAEAPGFPAELWQLTVQALYGTLLSARDLVQFARSSAANFLVETGGNTDGTGGSGAVYRLFHQALNDALLRWHTDKTGWTAGQQMIVQMFMAHGRRSRWQQAPDYLLRSLPHHAQAAGLIDSLLTDDAYLLHADLPRLLQVADGAVSEHGRLRARLLWLTPQAATAAPQERAALFSITEAVNDLGTTYSADRWDPPYRPQWAVVQPRSEITALEGHQGPVGAVCAMSVDGRQLLASGGDDGTVRFWDPGTGEHTPARVRHQGAVNAVCTVIVNAQQLLASAGDDGTVRLWDPATGEQRGLLEGDREPVRTICAMTVNGRPLLAIAGRDGTARFWDPGTGESSAARVQHQGGLNAVCTVIVNAQQLLASAGNDGTVRLWDPATGEQRGLLEGRREPLRAVCAVSMNGQQLLADACDDGMIQLWDPATGDHRANIDGHHEMVMAMCAFSVNGHQLLATGGDDGTIRLWDLVSGERHTTIDGDQRFVGALCAVSVNGQQLLATAGYDGTVRLWNPASGRQPASESYQDRVSAVCAVSVNGQQLLAAAGFDGSVRLRDPGTGEQRGLLEGHRVGVSVMCLVAVNGRQLLATAGQHDGMVRLWDLKTGQQRAALGSHPGGLTALCAVTVYGRQMLASGKNDGTIQLWDLTIGEQRTIQERNEKWLSALCAVSVNGQQLLASGSQDGTLRLWDPATGKQRISIESREDWVTALCTVSVNGQQLLASGSRHGALRLWDPAIGKQRGSLGSHHRRVNAVCTVSAHGHQLLASASEDRTVRLWDLSTGACVLSMPTHYEALAIEPVAASLAIGLDAGILVINPTILSA